MWPTLYPRRCRQIRPPGKSCILKYHGAGYRRGPEISVAGAWASNFIKLTNAQMYSGLSSRKRSFIYSCCHCLLNTFFKVEGEVTPGAQLTFYGDVAALRLDKLFADAQTQPRSVLPRSGNPEVAVEYTVQVLLIYALAGVGD